MSLTIDAMVQPGSANVSSASVTVHPSCSSLLSPESQERRMSMVIALRKATADGPQSDVKASLLLMISPYHGYLFPFFKLEAYMYCL